MEPDAITYRADNPTEAIHVLTLNCWGLKYISKLRSERLSEIGNRLAAYSPPLDIVALQECWTHADYASIREKTRHVLSHAKFYHSGIFGGGLAIFSRWPIEDSSMFRYSLNGRPTAFFRGDWYVGKGIACAKIRMPGRQAIEVFNTHLHAPYELEPNDSYICHRTAQAWEIGKLMKGAIERGNLVLGLGDFNMVPMSFAHALIESKGCVRDVWRILKPGSSVGASIDHAEKERRSRMNEPLCPDVLESLNEHGHTCDSVLNTWRWNKAHRKALEQGRDRKVEPIEEDPRAKRLDYIFFGSSNIDWKVQDVRVSLTERHPELRCSLSDHFAVEATLVRAAQPNFDSPQKTLGVNAAFRDPEGREASLDVVDLDDKDFDTALSMRPTRLQLEPQYYGDILKMIESYAARERKQRRYRTLHFVGSAFVSIGCFIAVGWSPKDFVAVILTLLSSLGLMAGTVDGLIGGLFVGSELRALAEFEWEVRNALQLAGGPVQEERTVKDWYD